MSTNNGSNAGSIYRLARYLGLVKPAEGEPRSRWARIMNVDRDSSGIEVVAGLSYLLVLILLVGTRAFADPVWFRPFADLAVLIFAGGLIRTLVIVIGRRR